MDEFYLNSIYIFNGINFNKICKCRRIKVFLVFSGIDYPDIPDHPGEFWRCFRPFGDAVRISIATISGKLRAVPESSVKKGSAGRPQVEEKPSAKQPASTKEGVCVCVRECRCPSVRLALPPLLPPPWMK